MTSDPFAAPVRVTRPLTGTTILLVEDSRFCSEAVRLMALRSGAKLRRANSVAAARRHLAMYRPDVVMVDVGLPDDAGFALIDELHRHRADGQAIVAMSIDDEGQLGQRAQALGADRFVPKPVMDLEKFQSLISDLVKTEPSQARRIEVHDPAWSIDGEAFLEDLVRITGVLETALPARDANQMRYAAQFVSSIAQTAQDQELVAGAKRFFRRMNRDGGGGARSGQEMLELLRSRLREAPEEISLERTG
ncbi:MAG: response regulator [Pseudomonadota bacterium]